MKARGPLILQVDRLEDRTCPSLFGPEMPAPVAEGAGESDVPVEFVPWGMESTGNPYDWIMMVMSPDQMMSVANEYDQSPDSASMLAPVSTGNGPDDDMASRDRMPGPAGEPMDESSAMPPGQMVMEQPPLVRRSLSPSKIADMQEMPDSETSGEDAKNGTDDAAMMSGGTGESPRTDQPPVLSPGELEPRIDPPLRSGPLEPELEKALPSG